MRNDIAILFCYSIGVFGASLFGGMVPLALKLTHRQLEIAVSLAAGIMLGSALFHLLPHAADQLGSYHSVSNWLLFGLLLMFFLERFFCFHHHDAALEDEHSHAECQAHGHKHGHSLSWTGVMVGLSVHSLLNGFALAASVAAERSLWGSGEPQFLPGLGVFFAVACHKPFDSMTVGTLMRAGGESVHKRMIVNGLFSIIVPVGVVLFYLGASAFTAGGTGQYFLGASLAFSAGIFLCIALSDLLPELQFHSHDRVKLSCALLLGILFAWLVGLLDTH